MKLVCSTWLLLIMAGSVDQSRGAVSLPATASPAHRQSASGIGNSFNPSFSANGQFVVFVSQAKNLASNGAASPYLDVFRRDLSSSNTVLVSVNASGWGGGNEDSNFPTISSNGQFVAFESEAGNLTPNDTNGFSDVFVRDLVEGTTTLVSVDTNGLKSGVRTSRSPIISANGCRVVFESLASNLVTNDFNGSGLDILVRDLIADTTTLVSINSAGTGSPLGAFNFNPNSANSQSPSMSADGRYVAFLSFATNIVTGTTNFRGEIFVRDIDGGTNIWASIGAAGFFTNPGAIQCAAPIISPSGRYVVFYASDEAFQTHLLLRYDIETKATTLVLNAFSYSSPSISDDGELVAYQTTNALLLADLGNGTREVVCDTSVFPDVAASSTPIISADGSQVAFLGAASTNGPWSVYVYHRDNGTRELVSLTTNGTAANVVVASEPAISPDNRMLAFESAATDLVMDDLNRAADVFVRDLNTATTHLVSARAPERPSVTSVLGASIGPRCVSEYGRFIAFTSLDNQLTESDTNPWQDAFVRDMVAGTNQWLSVPGTNVPTAPRLAFNLMLSTNGRYAAWVEEPVPLPAVSAVATTIRWLDRETGNYVSLNFSGTSFGNPGPSLSSDGRWLAFSDRPPGSTYLNIFVRDMLTPGASNQLVSVNRFGTGGGNGDSTAPLFSPDGKWVAFLSGATDLTTNATRTTPLVFARNLLTGVTRFVSTDALGLNTFVLGTSNPVFSGDSRYITFLDSLSGKIYRHDLKATNLNVLICAACFHPTMSTDGRFVAYEQRSASGNKDIMLRDMLTGQTNWVSTNISSASVVGGNRDSYGPQVSFDTRYVVFASKASNLVLNDTNNATDIFVYDRAQGTTMLVSQSVQGGPANSFSSAPVLAPDGRTIVFVSFASDLASGDFNTTRDVYVLRLGGPDTDADGMDDDWEMTYFNTLVRDGTGDFDGDGSTDLQEYRAGTDPTNGGSILRVLTLDSPGGVKTILWSAQPGRTYRVQFKRDVSDQVWTELPGMVTATDTTASKQDTGANGFSRRFYRVVLDF